jgi:hypothetical protein
MPSKRQQQYPHHYIEIACPQCGISRSVQRFYVEQNSICQRCHASHAAHHGRKSKKGFKGVFFDDTRSRKWRSSAQIDNVVYFLGMYPDAISAAEAYDSFVRQAYGDRAITNF